MQQPVRITSVDSNYLETIRDVRIMSVIMDRHETRIDAVELGKDERRPFRLDRITHSEVLRTVP